MYKIISLVITALVLSGCGSPASATTPAPTVNIRGAWVGQTEDSSFALKAKINRKTIKIWLVADDMTALYWKGTVPKNGRVTEGRTWTSKADTEALGWSLLGSTAKKKKFTLVNGEIHFNMSVFGVRYPEVLKRK